MAAAVAAALAPVSAPALPCGGAGAQHATAVAPALAVHPGDPRSLAAAWQQDRYRAGGGAPALGAAFSRDGGASWVPARVPGVTDCRGRSGRNGGGALSIGPDGTAYLVSSPGRLGSRGLVAGVSVSVSRDAGATWEAPVAVALPTGAVGADVAVAADPLRPGRAHAAWTRFDSLLTARTHDGGRTWTAPTLAAERDVIAIGGMAVAPSGTVLIAHSRAGRTTETAAVARSDDEGVSWSTVRLGAIEDATPYEARSGVAVRGGAVAAPAASADGSAHAAWITRGRLVAARSGDGGRRWSSPRRVVAGAAPMFAPGLAAGPGGVEATAYRLHRRGRADAVAARSLDRGRTWRARRLTRTFSLRRAPTIHRGERYLGERTAPVAAGAGFLTALALPGRGGTGVFLAP